MLRPGAGSVRSEEEGTVEFLGILYWERFQDTDRDRWGNAALALCREMQALEDVNFARYFWVSPNEIAIIIAADTAVARDLAMGRPNSRVARALFDFSDQSRLTREERMSDARQAMLTYRGAGR